MSNLPPQTPTSEQDEALPSGFRPTQHCPSLSILRAHQEEVLPATLAADVNQHIEQCPLCQTLLTDLQHIPQPAITTQERDRILRKLPHASSSVPAGWHWYAAAAAAFILAVAGAFLFLRQPQAYPSRLRHPPLRPRHVPHRDRTTNQPLRAPGQRQSPIRPQASS